MPTLQLLLFFTLLLSFPLSFSPASSLPLLPPDSIRATSSLRLMPSGYGPEDMVIDSLSSPPRLLVSCSSRRPEYPAYGEIEAINPAQNKRTVMKRIGDPAGLLFRPHGISLVQAGEILYLYVITHNDEKGIHPIIQYQVDGDTLIFIRMLESRLLVSPNALQAFPDGGVLVCNDAAVRNSMKEKILGQKRGNILYCDGSGNWSIVADKLGMPAGLTGMGNRIFVSGTLENRLYSFDFADGQLTGKKVVCTIKSPDNVRINNGNLLITSHTRKIKFIGHVKNKSWNSPSLVWEVDPVTGKTTRIFHDNGKMISAASAAVFFNHQLVIGQIFEPFLGLLDPDR